MKYHLALLEALLLYKYAPNPSFHLKRGKEKNESKDGEKDRIREWDTEKRGLEKISFYHSLHQLSIDLFIYISTLIINLSIYYLSTYLYIYLSIHLFISITLYPYIYPSIYLYIYPFIYLFIYPYILLSLPYLVTYLSVYQSIHSFFYQSIHSFFYLSIQPFIPDHWYPWTVCL